MTRVDVRGIRAGLKLSQKQFAGRFGFNLGTLQHWEQGSRRPDRAATILLALVANVPDVVFKIVVEMDERNAA